MHARGGAADWGSGYGYGADTWAPVVSGDDDLSHSDHGETGFAGLLPPLLPPLVGLAAAWDPAAAAEAWAAEARGAAPLLGGVAAAAAREEGGWRHRFALIAAAGAVLGGDEGEEALRGAASVRLRLFCCAVFPPFPLHTPRGS